MFNTHGKPNGPNRNLDDGNSDDGKSELKHVSEALDEALMESFPASDPIAISVTCVVTVAPAPQLRTF